MKKLLILTLVLLVAGLTSCEKNAMGVDVNTNIAATSDRIDVNDAEKLRSGADFTTSFYVDIDNEDTHNYLEKIEAVDLSDVVLTFDGLAALADNTTPVALSVIIDDEIVIDIPDFSYDQIAQGEPLKIVDAQKISAIADKLLTEKRVKITVSGSVPTPDPYHFYITFKAKAKISAGVL